MVRLAGAVAMTVLVLLALNINLFMTLVELEALIGGGVYFAWQITRRKR